MWKVRAKLLGQSSIYKALVYGWYGKNNLGDELFKLAFQRLLPDFEFKFVDKLVADDVARYDNIFIGGGSFLDQDPCIEQECFDLLKRKKLFYIGVGLETNIHPSHKELMISARLVAARTKPSFELKNFILIPDLVFSLHQKTDRKKSGKVLVVPNATVIPNNTSPHWKYAAWNYFKSEFSQFLDGLKKEIDFFPMCLNNDANDLFACGEIINHMSNKNVSVIMDRDYNIFSDYDVVISQRYHGLVLAEMFSVPFLSVYHHDKLKSTHYNNGSFISYYEPSKKNIIDNFQIATNLTPSLVIDNEEMFGGLISAVRERCQDLLE